ncbi:MAG: S8 family serine peptidase [Candidatus Eremiobacteraeota bacterium]|nr:S8 family serine peptidase [Candidatus Eremiobacteraeota bacterium]
MNINFFPQMPLMNPSFRPQAPARVRLEETGDRFEAGSSEVRAPNLAQMLALTRPSRPDGNGVTILYIDDDRRLSTHGREVARVGRTNAPGAGAVHVGLPAKYPGFKAEPGASLESMSGQIDRSLADPFVAAVAALRNVGHAKVVNMSVGMPLVSVYERLLRALDPSEQRKDELAPKIVALVQQRLEAEGSPAQLARQQFRQRVAELAEQGVVVVVAAGNWNQEKLAESNQFWLQQNPMAHHNLLADPDSQVIAVGATDGRGRMTSASAPGAPTVTAPSHPPFGGPRGTSWAAPHVASTIAMMLQVNPRLTVQQIRQILIASAQKQGHGRQFEGHGEVNRERAIELAREAA